MADDYSELSVTKIGHRTIVRPLYESKTFLFLIQEIKDYVHIKKRIARYYYQFHPMLAYPNIDLNVTTMDLSNDQDDFILDSSLLDNPPSVHIDGFDLLTEQRFRITGCCLIRSLAQMFNIEQLVIIHAQYLYNRFYYYNSFLSKAYDLTALACLVITIEQDLSIKKRVSIDVIMKAYATIMKFPSSSFVNLKSYLNMQRLIVLESLNYSTEIRLPHLFLFSLIKHFNLLENQLFIHISLAFLNDTYLCDVVFRFNSETIALACFWHTSAVTNTPLPENWHRISNIELSTINNVCASFLLIYFKKKISMEEVSKVKSKLISNDQILKLKEFLLLNGIMINNIERIGTYMNYRNNIRPGQSLGQYVELDKLLDGLKTSPLGEIARSFVKSEYYDHYYSFITNPNAYFFDNDNFNMASYMDFSIFKEKLHFLMHNSNDVVMEYANDHTYNAQSDNSFVEQPVIDDDEQTFIIDHNYASSFLIENQINDRRCDDKNFDAFGFKLDPSFKCNKRLYIDNEFEDDIHNRSIDDENLRRLSRVYRFHQRVVDTYIIS